MNKIYTKITTCIASLLLMFLTDSKAIAQCDDLTLSLTTTHSTCLSNGKIKVTISGPDAANIRQSDMEFQVSGSKNIAFSPYANNTIEHLPAGTYTINLRAFCKITNDWIIATTQATTTITTSYKEMNFSLGRTIATLNCKHTGVIPVVIESGTGSAPFTIEITSKPVAYTGTTVFTSSSRNYDISNLPAGSYTIKVVDDCGYTVENRTTTVSTRAQDYYNVFYTYLYPQNLTSCNMVRTNRNSISSTADPDAYYYYYTKVSEYFEVAFLFNNTGTKVWQTLTTSNINMTLPSPYSYKKMREENAYYAVYLRVKGCTTEHRIQDLKLTPTPAVSLTTTAVCDVLNISFYTYSDYDGTFCYPYEWRIVRSDNSVFLDWQGPVSNTTPQTASNVPTGTTIQFRDSEGYTWSRYTTGSVPKPSLSSSRSEHYTYLEPDGLYRSLVRPYFYPSTFPAGTTFKYLSGPTVPVHQTGTLSTASSYIYPYSSNFTTSDYARMDPGSYKFTVTRPGCSPDTIVANHSVYKLASKPIYTLKEECDGLLVTFAGGGQMQLHDYSGAISNSGTPYIRVSNSIPSGLPYNDQNIVTHGGSLKLPQAGSYVISLSTYNSASATVIYRDTIVYSPTPFTLDHSVTSAYLCQGEATGFIRVKGSGGTGKYKYELYDSGILKYTNTTGVFSYGVAGGTYKIILYDTECGYSYPQDLTLVDLGIAQIAYSSRPDNKFCTSDSIYLKCLTLGETTYTWSGPGITAANKNKQNPAIFANDVGVGVHTYTIKVTPESCGTEMTQTVTIIVEDCEGARDDYKTMLVNTTDSVDILLNDGYPSSCASSVSPVITVAPTKGTAMIVNKKVVYTPIKNFIGKDSLTYRVTCNGITTAKVYFNIIPYPDNIVDSSLCTIPFNPIVFDVKKAWASPTSTAHGQTGALVGDLDGDGVPEIITIDKDLTTLNVLDGSTGTVKTSLAVPLNSGNGGWHPVFTGALVDSDKNGMGELIYASNDNKLISYEADTTGGTFKLKQKWQTTFVSPTTGIVTDNKPQPVIADFNGDGIPEVVVFHQIFNAKTGALLGVTEAVASAYVGRITNRGGNNRSNFMTAIDFDGDGLPEIAAGGKVYKVEMNAAGTVATCSILYQTTAFGDGFTSVADVDLDGNMDVVVVDFNSLTRINIWSPKDNRVIDQISIANSDAYQGYAFIGDIDGVISSDGKRYPEICVTTRRITPLPLVGRVSAYKYNPTTKKYVHKWDLINTDTSGGTGITLFDFNNDGVNELVYRDQDSLYILNGVADAAPVLASNSARFRCTSGTAFEYPVIADLDGSGSAKICVTCANNGSTTNTLNAFESATTPWAPTRKVWNQVNYEPTGINDDLTVPVYLFPKNYMFNVGTNQYWPFNGALIQIPITDSDLNPVVNAADPYVAGVSSEILNNTTIRVSVVIGNYGVMNTNASLPVALYIESIAAANLFEVKPIGVALAPGNTVTLHYDIPVNKAKNQVYVRIQDDGTAYPASGSYTDCDYSNNTMSGITVIAVDDNILAQMGKTATINVLANDFLGSCNTSTITLSIETGAVNGSASVTPDNKITYTPAPASFEGDDSIKYKITCGGVSDYAMVYIYVRNLPDNIIEPDCWTTPERKEWDIQLYQQVGNVATTAAFVVGDMNADGFPDIVAYGNKSRTSIKIFWGPEFTSIKEIAGVNADSNTSLAIGRVKVSDTPSETYDSYIFYRSGSTLKAVRPDGTNPWTETPNSRYPGMIGLADFNRDGWTEVYLGNQIYDAATGKLLCDGGSSENSGSTLVVLANAALPTAIDILGDLDLELVAGNKIYKVDIDRNTPTPKNLTLLSSVTPPAGCLADGLSIVADFDNDGQLEVLVRRREANSGGNKKVFLYLWSPHTGTSTGTILASTNDTYTYFGVPFVGDIDGDGFPEIVTLGSNGAYQTQKGFKARRYNKTAGTLELLWDNDHIDQSGATGMTLFDFNNDGISEIVYRDESYLRIINASGKSHITGADTIGYYVINSFTSYSETFYEYPVVVDLYGNNSSAILVTSDLRGPRPSGYDGNATIDIYTSDPASPWAPARKVWNQYGYNPVNVNEDLTIPKVPLNVATVFPGGDGLLGTADDVRPYNNFLQQQTLLNKDGVPIFTVPDAAPVQSVTSSVVIGDSVSISVGIYNKGDAALGSPIYVTLYKESISASNKIATGSYAGYINPGDTGYVTVSVSDITPFLPMLNVVIRVNDDGTDFTYQPECDDTNNEITILNPAMSLMMKKSAKLEGVPHDGSYSNPVSVLYNEDIEYTITAVNANLSNNANMIIRDTLPPYLKYQSSTPTVTPVTVGGSPSRIALEWTISGMASMATASVKVVATPIEGCVSSQPMFINGAWVLVSDTIYVPTNNTYHQGACLGIATFSAGLGGNIYNASEQALDYKTTPRSGIVIVPDEGYRFSGWSHDDYISLRSERIKAQDEIMHYDTLTVYGNVQLHANFELEEYPVRYHLNGGSNVEDNPSSYTIKSGDIILKVPAKSGDEFIGWTGSNGEKPQLSVTIPKGSTGELEYYANYLYSGREEESLFNGPEEDKIWSAENVLYIRTSKVGSLVRIYTTEGVLQHQQKIIRSGETKIELSRGFYVITLDDDIGKIVRIE